MGAPGTHRLRRWAALRAAMGRLRCASQICYLCMYYPIELYSVKTILHVALDLHTTHTADVIMARHYREIMHVFGIVYQTLFSYSRNPKSPIGPFLMLAPIWRHGFVETPIPLDGLILLLWKRPTLGWLDLYFNDFSSRNNDVHHRGWIGDEPQMPKSSQSDPWKDPIKTRGFCTC